MDLDKFINDINALLPHIYLDENRPIDDLIKMLYIAQNLAPKVQINPDGTYYLYDAPDVLSQSEKLIVRLFNRKAFDEKTADETPCPPPSDERLHKYVIYKPSECGWCWCHLTYRGGFKAQGILASVHNRMVNVREEQWDNI